MAESFINVGNVPLAIEAIAAEALAHQRPRKLKYVGGEVINVGLWYRLFKPRHATCFQLMTHERYNKLASKKKR